MQLCQRSSLLRCTRKQIIEPITFNPDRSHDQIIIQPSLIISCVSTDQEGQCTTRKKKKRWKGENALSQHCHHMHDDKYCHQEIVAYGDGGTLRWFFASYVASLCQKCDEGKGYLLHSSEKELWIKQKGTIWSYSWMSQSSQRKCGSVLYLMLSQWCYWEQLLLCSAVTVTWKQEGSLWRSLPYLSTAEANTCFRVNLLEAGAAACSRHVKSYWAWNFSDTLPQEPDLAFAARCCSLSCSVTSVDRHSWLLESRWGISAALRYF